MRTWLFGGALFLAAGLPAAAQAPAQPEPTRPAPAKAAPEKPVDPARLDLAYGAYQRGLFLTAFNEATKRIEADPKDAAAMTLLGELYNQG
ncbi:MAG TPA: sel1 repeat family protein, partial [Devosia sp.]|nr:sel1 repeat family protein [Devosia sp.]